MVEVVVGRPHGDFSSSQFGGVSVFGVFLAIDVRMKLECFQCCGFGHNAADYLTRVHVPFFDNHGHPAPLTAYPHYYASQTS